MLFFIEAALSTMVASNDEILSFYVNVSDLHNFFSRITLVVCASI